jgi:hypothetical protein
LAAFAVIDGCLLNPLRQAGDLDVERAGPRQKTDIAGLVRVEQHDRLLAPRVAVAPRGLDQIVRRVRLKAPGDLVAVAIVRDRDVQPVHSPALNASREPGGLNGPEAAAAGAPVVGNRHVLDHPSIRPDEDRAEIGRAAGSIAIAFFHHDYQFARLGEKIGAASAPDVKRNPHGLLLGAGGACDEDRRKQQLRNSCEIHGLGPWCG